MSDSVVILENTDEQNFFDNYYIKRIPIVLRGMDIGPCTQKWDIDYLSAAVGTQEVKVHVSSTPMMNFLKKNFLYRSLPFNELIKRASEFEHADYFISNTELYYLRSLGRNARKDTADIKQQFPNLANDIIFPELIPKDKIFSSVFRIASGGIILWTHYDIMDNMLIQIKGRKRVVLFSPDDVSKLYLNGDKSEVLDIDNPDVIKYQKFIKAKKYEVYLQPGDILFIPALWFHNVKSLEFGIAVNVFWKNLDEILYDKKDPYGNKDLLPAQHAFSLLNKALLSINKLPSIYKKFYSNVMITQIQRNLETDSVNSVKSE